MRLALSLKGHVETLISFKIITVLLSTWWLLSSYHMNFPGWTQDIYKTVPPDRSSKMTEQPSTKKTFWRAGVAIATEQPSFVTHSSGKETTFFLFPHILSSIVFFSIFLPCHPKTTARWAAHSHMVTEARAENHGWEAGRNIARSSLWHIVHVTLACYNAAHTCPHTFTVMFTSSALQELLTYHQRLIHRLRHKHLPSSCSEIPFLYPCPIIIFEECHANYATNAPVNAPPQEVMMSW